MITVIEDKCTPEQIVIQSDRQPFNEAIMELKNPDVRRMAISAATKMGIANAACGILGSAYPVDAEGNVIQAFGAGGGVKVAAYRIDIPITAAIHA